jgi:clan AA aspartic protease
MIRGSVTEQLEAWIDLTLIGRDGSRFVFSAVIDTGFSGFLTLPQSVLSKLGGRKLGEALVDLADGSEVLSDVFEANIIWNDRPRRIEVDAADTEPLVGMALLARHDLQIQVVPNGAITIATISD